MISRRSVMKLLSGLPLGGLIAGGWPNTARANSTATVRRNVHHSIYETIGVRPLINARGTVTIIGATRMILR